LGNCDTVPNTDRASAYSTWPKGVTLKCVGDRLTSRPPKLSSNRFSAADMVGCFSPRKLAAGVMPPSSTTTINVRSKFQSNCHGNRCSYFFDIDFIYSGHFHYLFAL
jgi:hypothetical protein